MDIDDDQDNDMDAYDLVEPSDVLGALGRDFYKQLVDPKWTIRKEALQHLKSLASQPRLAPGDYGELLRELKKIITKDSNVVCQAETVGCYAALARGLRRDFAAPARHLAGVLLDKLKEKNAGVTAACKDALDAMHRYCFSLQEVVEDVAAALEHKNPKVRGDTLQLLGAMIPREPREGVVKLLPSLAPVVVKNAMEASPELRDAAMLTLTGLAVKLGRLDKALTKFTDKMDETRSKRLQDLVTQVSGCRADVGGLVWVPYMCVPYMQNVAHFFLHTLLSIPAHTQALESGSMPTTTSGGALLTARGPRLPSIAVAGAQGRGDSQSSTPASRGGSATARGRPPAGGGGAPPATQRARPASAGRL